MSFQSEFIVFWEKTIQSIENCSFTKFTLAKTIGNTDIKNVYMHLIKTPNGFNARLTTRYKTKETETICSLEEAFEILQTQLYNPFLTALLFTTKFDFVFKINKKKNATILEQNPTFKKPDIAFETQI